MYPLAGVMPLGWREFTREMRAPSSAPLMSTLNVETFVPAGMLTSAWKDVKFKWLQQPPRIEPTDIPIVEALGHMEPDPHWLYRQVAEGPQSTHPALF